MINKFAWMFGGEVVGKGMLFIVQILLARRLSIEDFGVFSLVFAIVNFGWMVTNFGSGLYGTREIARQASNHDMHAEILSSVISLRTALFAVFFIGVIVAAYVNAIGLSVSAFMLLMTVSVAFRCLTPDWYYKGLREFEITAKAMAVGFFCLFGMVYLRNTSELSLDYVGLSWFVSYFFIFFVYVVAFLMAGKVNVSSLKVWSIERGYHTAAKTRGFWLGGLGSNLYQLIPIIYISEFYTNYEVGVFSALYKVILGFVFVIGLFPSFIYTYLASLATDDDVKEFASMARLLHRVVLLVAGLSAIIVVVYSSEILDFGLGEKYVPSADALSIFALFIVLRSLRESIYMILSALDRQTVYARVTLALPFAWLASLSVLQIFVADIIQASVMSMVISEALSVLILYFYYYRAGLMRDISTSGVGWGVGRQDM